MGEAPEDAGFTPPLFSIEQVDALVAFCSEHGKARAKMQGSDFSEFDYLAGVMSMFFALRLQGKIPARWIFDAFTGRSPLDLKIPDAQVYIVMAGQLRQPVAVYKHRREAQEHVEQLWRQGDEYAFIATEPVRQAVLPKVQERIDAYFDETETSL